MIISLIVNFIQRVREKFVLALLDVLRGLESFNELFLQGRQEKICDGWVSNALKYFRISRLTPTGCVKAKYFERRVPVED